MSHYVFRRLLLIVPTLLTVTMVIFLLIRLIPGDVVTMMVDQNLYAADVPAMREKLGLTKPVPVQYLLWVKGILQGNLGESLWTKRAATQELLHRGPVSLELGLLALTFAIAIGIPLGVLSAIRLETERGGGS